MMKKLNETLQLTRYLDIMMVILNVEILVLVWFLAKPMHRWVSELEKRIEVLHNDENKDV